MPDGHVLVSATVDGSSIAAEGKWVSVRFAEPISVAAQQTVWAVLKARAGEANWLADASGEAGTSTMRFSRDGAFWTIHEPPLIGLYKLKIVPSAAESPAALSAEVLTRTGIPLQPTETPQTAAVVFENGADLQGNQIPLKLVPEAAGQIKLTSVVIEYVPVTETGG
jgi:hypothetical protein